MTKLVRTIGLACDLAVPVLIVLTGVGLIVGGATGVLWL